MLVMMKWKRWLIIGMQSLVLPLTIPSSVAEMREDTQGEIAGFVHLLDKTYTPTLADYYKYESRGEGPELEFELKECEHRGWVPNASSEQCVTWERQRQQQETVTPSLFYAWLKTKLPANPRYTINSIKAAGNDQLRGKLISVNFNEVEVIFWKTSNPDYVSTFGRLAVSEINGAKLRELIKKEFAAPVKNK